MTAKNFSPGDVVVCVLVDEDSPELTLRALYTVVEPFVCCDTGRESVSLNEVIPVEGDGWGFCSYQFRLAYTPDPEVERERAEAPIKRPVSA